MKRDTLIASMVKRLNKARSTYINSQLKAESGLVGTFRKTGLKSIAKDKGLEYLVKAKNNYYSILAEYRKLMINDFKRANRRIIQNDIKLLARITIFDEVKKLREEKEKKLRSQGLKGILRTQLQEWREISPHFKMIMGLVLGFIGILLSFVSPGIFWLQAPLLGWGLIVFFEGAQQKLTSQKAIKEGMNRLAIYQSANKKLARIKTNLATGLAKVHQELEADIWKIRVFEKMTEYRRYIVAGTAGILIGSVYLIPFGIKAIVYTSVAAIVGRATWFMLPYGAIREGLADVFHRAPIPEAMASTRAEHEMTGSADFDGANLTVDQQNELLYQGGQTGIYGSGGEFGYGTLPFEQEHAMINDPNYNEFGGTSTSVFSNNYLDSGNPAVADAKDWVNIIPGGRTTTDVIGAATGKKEWGDVHLPGMVPGVGGKTINQTKGQAGRMSEDVQTAAGTIAGEEGTVAVDGDNQGSVKTGESKIVVSPITQTGQNSETQTQEVGSETVIEGENTTTRTGDIGNTAAGDAIAGGLNKASESVGEGVDVATGWAGDKVNQAGHWFNSLATGRSSGLTPSYNQYTGDPDRYSGFELVNGKVVPVGSVGSNITEANASGTSQVQEVEDKIEEASGTESEGGKDIGSTGTLMPSQLAQGNQVEDALNTAINGSSSGTQWFGSLRTDTIPYTNITFQDALDMDKPTKGAYNHETGLFEVYDAEKSGNATTVSEVTPTLNIDDDTDDVEPYDDLMTVDDGEAKTDQADIVTAGTGGTSLPDVERSNEQITFQDLVEKEGSENLTPTHVINAEDAIKSEVDAIRTNVTETDRLENTGLLPAEEAARASNINANVNVANTFKPPWATDNWATGVGFGTSHKKGEMDPNMINRTWSGNDNWNKDGNNNQNNGNPTQDIFNYHQPYGNQDWSNFGPSVDNANNTVTDSGSGIDHKTITEANQMGTPDHTSLNQNNINGDSASYNTFKSTGYTP